MPGRKRVLRASKPRVEDLLARTEEALRLARGRLKTILGPYEVPMVNADSHPPDFLRSDERLSKYWADLATKIPALAQALDAVSSLDRCRPEQDTRAEADKLCSLLTELVGMVEANDAAFARAALCEMDKTLVRIHERIPSGLLEELQSPPRRVGKKRRRGGRPTDSDPKQDRKVSDAWASKLYETYADLGRELDMTEKDVERALDRHRKRQSKR